MSSIIDILKSSRVAAVVEKVEKGESVDINRELALQALDIARIGELYAVELLEREDIADGQFAAERGGQGPSVWGLPEAPSVAG